MLNLTNAEADHLARHAEKGAELLRELAADHRQRADAMHVIGERLMEWYHQAKFSMCLDAAAALESDAADLRARRKPAAPVRPDQMPNPVPTAEPKRGSATWRQRRAIEEHTSLPPGGLTAGRVIGGPL